MLEVSLVRAREFGSLASRWDAIVERQPAPRSPFLRSWWLEAVASADDHAVLVLDDGEVLGGIPLQLGRRRGIPYFRLAGADFRPVHVDVVARSGHRDTVEATLRSWFRAQRHGIVAFDGLREHSRLQTALPPRMHGHELPGNPYVHVPSDLDELLQRRSRGFRRDLYRPTRRLDDAGYHYRQLRPDETEQGLAALRRLHVAQHQQRSTFRRNLDPFCAAARVGIKRGEFALHVVAKRDHIIAVDAVFEVGDHVLDYQSGRDDSDPAFRGAGNVLLGGMIETYARRGDVRWVDLGRHTAAYKMRWADGVWPLGVLEGSWGWGPQALEQAKHIRGRARRLAHRTTA